MPLSKLLINSDTFGVDFLPAASRNGGRPSVIKFTDEQKIIVCTPHGFKAMDSKRQRKSMNSKITMSTASEDIRLFTRKTINT